MAVPSLLQVAILPCNRMEQVSYRKQCTAEDRARKIEVMAWAMFRSPIHSREDPKGFADMSTNNNHEASSAD